MDSFVIEGGVPLKGEVTVSGSKNAALPILLASLLTEEDCAVERVPDLRDIKTAFKLLESLGKKVEYSGGRALIRQAGPASTSAPYELVKQMRASVLVAGPLLARFGKAQVPLPGGCAIGLRPVDIHIKSFKAMGASVKTVKGNLNLETKGLRGAPVRLSFPSVGATENVMMCAALTPGVTVIENAAREPEIEDLAKSLQSMGAKIRFEAEGRISVEGAAKLRGMKHKVIPDRIETGTYIIAAAATAGDVLVKNCEPEHNRALLSALAESGASVSVEKSSVRVKGAAAPSSVNIETEPYPGFPTDLQAPWMAYMCAATGMGRIKEAIFEKRFMHAPELLRMGAEIFVEGNTAYISGGESMSGASVMASDLRGGAALVVAAMMAHGESLIQRIYHIDRGYERMEEKLSALGAKIKRVRS